MTAILGAPEATKGQAARWVLDKAHTRGNPAYHDSLLATIVNAYYEVGEEEGVRADVALAQAVKETAAFNFGGSVQPEQWNFAGVGATGPGVPGMSWPTIRDGARGHLRRLRMYAEGSDDIYDLEILQRPLPRQYWAAAPNVEDLGGRWAPSPDYGVSIVDDYLLPLGDTAEPTDWSDHWAAVSIQKVMSVGLMGVSEGGAFRPDDPVTRGQLAAILDRLGLLD